MDKRLLLGISLIAGCVAQAAPAHQSLPYVKPGAQLLYYGGSSSRSDVPGQGTSAGVGMTRYEVVAVGRDKVYLNASTYLGTGQKDGVYTFAGNNGLTSGGMDVTSGMALWMPPSQLRSLQSGGGVQVVRGAYPIDGKSYDSVSMTILGKDSASRNVFEATSGVKLAMQSASGSMNPGYKDPFMRQYQTFATYESRRQVDTFLGPVPPWVATVQEVSYGGSVSMAGAQMSLGTTATYSVIDRGPDWLIANISTQVQSGFGPSSQPEVKQTIEGPGKTLGLWISPQALARLTPGVVDRDPTLGTTISYQIQGGPLGQLGVLTETNDRRTYTIVAGYNLQDGMLSYAQQVQPQTGYSATMQLQGRR